jgi:hypothetical protein
MTNTTKLTLALRASSIRNLTAAELSVANGGKPNPTCAKTNGTKPPTISTKPPPKTKPTMS